ncbi:TolC family protein [Alteromonas sp. 5E99-2]|uniref:TolC family protein n=1 Tax=Alteromonas sp. 5E99-2 TaxID=2817683 RepID=UPI001A986176|nr:TolC family protein [Alteromonas sp. 5E99-2]
MNRMCRLFLIAVSAVTSLSTSAQTGVAISLDDVLKSTLKHHPRVAQALSQQQQAQAKQLQSQGVFDWQVDQNSFVRTGGFFDGAILDQSVSKALPFANAKVSAGYRISDGEFPIYENINNTLAGGETYIKASLSLLKDREIDKNRADIINADFDADIAQEQQKLILNDLLLNATLQYLEWKRVSERKVILEKLLALAETRLEGIEKQVKAGEIAQISITEYQVTLLQRKAELLANKQVLQKHTIGLSMFLRDNEGKPKSLPENAYASYKLAGPLSKHPEKLDLLNTLKAHPQLVKLEQEINQIRAKLQLNENSVLPKLDVSVLLANDIGGRGDRSGTLEGVESYVSVDFSLPIGQRVAKGKAAQTKAKLLEVQAKKQETLESIDIQLNQAFTALTNLTQLRDIREAQANVAERLMKEEQNRFDAGASDLFILNARETNFTRAQMAALNANIELQIQHFVILAGSATLHERVLM